MSFSLVLSYFVLNSVDTICLTLLFQSTHISVAQCFDYLLGGLFSWVGSVSHVVQSFLFQDRRIFCPVPSKRKSLPQRFKQQNGSTCCFVFPISGGPFNVWQGASDSSITIQRNYILGEIINRTRFAAKTNTKRNHNQQADQGTIIVRTIQMPTIY